MSKNTQIENFTPQEGGKPLLEVAQQIIEYRIVSCDKCPQSYKRKKIERLEQLGKEQEEDNPEYFRNGIHYEALFFTALNQRYYPNSPYQNPSVLVSTGNQDQRGIDFVIKTKNKKFPIDVTINPESYPRKLRSKKSLPLLLPMLDPETEKNYLNYFKKHLLETDLEDFLQKVFWLNTHILNNKHENYSVTVKERKTKKRYNPCSQKYKLLSPIEIPHYNRQHQISISKKRYQEMLNLLSLIKNTNP